MQANRCFARVCFLKGVVVMKMRHKLIGAFVLLSVLFLVYFHYLDRSQYLKQQIRQNSREMEYLSNLNNHYLKLMTEQRQLAQQYQSSDILYVHVSDQDMGLGSMEARAWDSASETRRQLSSLLFSQ